MSEAPAQQLDGASALLIDTFLPAFDATDFHALLVDASPERSFAAVRNLDLAETMRVAPVARDLMSLRGLPMQVRARLRGEALPDEPESLHLTEVDRFDWSSSARPGRRARRRRGRTVLDVGGAVAAAGGFRVSPLRRTGYAKIAWNFVRRHAEASAS
jgi:hypothetical protein